MKAVMCLTQVLNVLLVAASGLLTSSPRMSTAPSLVTGSGVCLH